MFTCSSGPPQDIQPSPNARGNPKGPPQQSHEEAVRAQAVMEDAKCRMFRWNHESLINDKVDGEGYLGYHVPAASRSVLKNVRELISA
jgi:hypothetical protein